MPCRAVHTFGMKFRIDVVFFSESGEVLAVFENVRPCRLCFCWRAKGVIEAATGWTRRERVSRGDRIDWRSSRES